MNNLMKKILLVILMLYSGLAFSHKSSDSYFNIDASQPTSHLKLEVAIQDLSPVLNFDENDDGKITWREVKSIQHELTAYVFSRINIFSNDERCKLQPENLEIARHSDGAYVVFKALLSCNVTKIQYDLLFDIDQHHRGLFSFKSSENSFAQVFSPDNNVLLVENSMNDTSQNFMSFLTEGVWHIWIGYDHVLFLISLLIPTVLVRRKQQWQGVESATVALTEIVKVVSAFTIAHSITLCLVIFGLISLSVSIAESIIAFSVIVAALLNVIPQLNIRRWLLGFGFGLIHGFGFASVLSELSIESDSLFISLLGFNLGVELGQLAIILVLFPVAFYIRSSWFYKKMVLQVGSYIIAMFGFVWFIERII